MPAVLPPDAQRWRIIEAWSYRALSAALVGTLFGDAPSFDRVAASSVALDQMAASDLGESDPALHQLVATMGRRAGFLLQRRELKSGDASPRLRAQHAPDIRRSVDKALGIQASMQAAARAILDNLRDLAAARQAQATLRGEADQLGHALAMDCAGSDAGAPGPWRAPGAATASPASVRP